MAVHSNFQADVRMCVRTTHVLISDVDANTYLNSTIQILYKMDVSNKVDPNPMANIHYRC